MGLLGGLETQVAGGFVGCELKLSSFAGECHQQEPAGMPSFLLGKLPSLSEPSASALVSVL